MKIKVGDVLRPAITQGYFIYGLIDPLTGLVRYVGRTRTPQMRLDQHISEALCRSNQGPSQKAIWIKGLIDEGRHAEMVILEITDRERFESAEMARIKSFPSGQLANGDQRKGGRVGIPANTVTQWRKSRPIDYEAQARRIREFQKQHKLNQREFAEKLGVNYSTVSRWINGSREMPEQAIRLLTTLERDSSVK